MFCPGCGSEQAGQYCRSCGVDLRSVRTALEKPDAVAASAISARDEIARAVADKIREVKSAKELGKVVENILPEIEAFLETPEEKRLRRIRAGMITAAIGMGVALAFFFLAAGLKDNGLLFLAGFGLITFLIGLGILINGWHFTVPEKRGIAQAHETLIPSTTRSLPGLASKAAVQEQLFAPSVTEHTTHHLSDS